MKNLLSLFIAMALLPLTGFAHEGHGHTDGSSVTHYFVEPEHMFAILAAAAFIVLGSIYFRKKEKPIDKM